jgi:hypothetical protein
MGEYLDRLKAPRGNKSSDLSALLRAIRPASLLVYILPLILGMTLPGEKIGDPQGWLVGFWRVPFVALIVLAQVVCFVSGWFLSVGPSPVGTIARRGLAAVYIVLMSFWLGRNYFFGVVADFQTCARLWALCFLPTVIMDHYASKHRDRLNSWQRND